MKSSPLNDALQGMKNVSAENLNDVLAWLEACFPPAIVRAPSDLGQQIIFQAGQHSVVEALRSYMLNSRVPIRRKESGDVPVV